MYYLIIAAFLWGTSFIAGKYAYGMFEPVMLVQLRLAIAALCCLPLFIKAAPTIPHHLWKRLAFIALLTFPTTFILQFLGLKHTSAASATTMLGIEPLMVVIVGYCFFAQPARRIDWLMAIVAFIGVALVVGGDAQGASLYGCSLVLLSTVVVAVWMQLSKDLLSIMPSHHLTAITMVLGAILCLPFTLVFTQDIILTPSKQGILALLYLSLGCSLFAAWAWNTGLQRSSTNSSGIFFALEPVFGVMLALWILNERMTPIGYIGVILVILAAAISMLYQPKKQDIAAEPL